MHSAGRCRIRCTDGGRARSLCRSRPIRSARWSASTRALIQLIGEVREPIPAKPGQLERYDCEYKRNGTANLFVFLDVHRPWRKVKVTESRAAVDFAACMRELATRETAGSAAAPTARCRNRRRTTFMRFLAPLLDLRPSGRRASPSGVCCRGCARARPSCSNASTIPCQGVRWSPGKPTSSTLGNREPPASGSWL